MFHNQKSEQYLFLIRVLVTIQSGCVTLAVMPRGGKRIGAGRKPVFVYPATKRCPTCNGGDGAVLSGTSFHRDRSTKSGLQSRCKACLCKRRRALYLKTGTPEKDQYMSFKAAAARRGRRFAINFEQFRALRLLPCAYGGGSRPEIRIGLDRKDNLTGYTPQNCVPCCQRHNAIKSHIFSHSEMQFIVANVKSAKQCGNKPFTVRIVPRST